LIMPSSDNAMDDEQVGTVKTWIDEGALDN
jgi:hypothetical protein